MELLTSEKFSELRQAMASSYGVSESDLRRCFTVSEPLETRLNSAIQESSDFLQRITVLPVTDRIGQAVTVGVHQPLAKRTDVSSGDRQATPAESPIGAQYQCELTEFDVAFPYTLLDAWARFDNFQELYMAQVYRRIALDRILTGWRGKTAAASTDRSANPNLEDVNVGWIEILKQNNPGNYLTESTDGTSKITLGASGDYKNLDQLAYDVQSMIPDAYRTGSEVVIVGRHLVAHDVGKALAAVAQTPTEKNQVLILDKFYGGLQAILVPGFPATGLVVTDTENLSLYYQRGKTRRQQLDNSRRNRVEDYISSNDAYVIENLDGIAGIEADNLEFAD